MSQRGPSVAPGRPNATTRVQCDHKKIVVPMVPAGFECRGLYVRVTFGSCWKWNFANTSKSVCAENWSDRLRMHPKCVYVHSLLIWNSASLCAVAYSWHIWDVLGNNFASFVFEGVLQMTINSSFNNYKTWYMSVIWNLQLLLKFQKRQTRALSFIAH